MTVSRLVPKPGDLGRLLRTGWSAGLFDFPLDVFHVDLGAGDRRKFRRGVDLLLSTLFLLALLDRLLTVVVEGHQPADASSRCQDSGQDRTSPFERLQVVLFGPT